MSLSSRGGPANCGRRPPTRNKNVSESSEPSCAGSDSVNVTASRQFSCPDDSSSLSGINSTDKVKRKKRRKIYTETKMDKQTKISKRPEIHTNLKRLVENHLKLNKYNNKLKDNRIPFVGLTRLNSQPKLVQKKLDKTKTLGNEDNKFSQSRLEEQNKNDVKAENKTINNTDNLPKIKNYTKTEKLLLELNRVDLNLEPIPLTKKISDKQFVQINENRITRNKEDVSKGKKLIKSTDDISIEISKNENSLKTNLEYEKKPIKKKDALVRGKKIISSTEDLSTEKQVSETTNQHHIENKISEVKKVDSIKQKNVNKAADETFEKKKITRSATEDFTKTKSDSQTSDSKITDKILSGKKDIIISTDNSINSKKVALKVTKLTEPTENLSVEKQVSETTNQHHIENKISEVKKVDSIKQKKVNKAADETFEKKKITRSATEDFTKTKRDSQTSDSKITDKILSGKKDIIISADNSINSKKVALKVTKLTEPTENLSVEKQVSETTKQHLIENKISEVKVVDFLRQKKVNKAAHETSFEKVIIPKKEEFFNKKKTNKFTAQFLTDKEVAIAIKDNYSKDKNLPSATNDCELKSSFDSQPNGSTELKKFQTDKKNSNFLNGASDIDKIVEVRVPKLADNHVKVTLVNNDKKTDFNDKNILSSKFTQEKVDNSLEQKSKLRQYRHVKQEKKGKVEDLKLKSCQLNISKQSNKKAEEKLKPQTKYDEPKQDKIEKKVDEVELINNDIQLILEQDEKQVKDNKSLSNKLHNQELREDNFEERVHLPPGINVPANLNVKVFCELSVPLNKMDTDNFMKKYKKNLQNIDANSTNKESKSLTVNFSDINKSAQELKNDLKTFDKNDEVCNEKQTKNCSEKYMQISEDKVSYSQSDKLIEESNLVQIQNSYSNMTKSRIKSFKSLIPSNKRLHNLNDQNNDKLILDSGKQNCLKNLINKSDQIKSNPIDKNTKECINDSVQEIPKLLQNRNDNNHQLENIAISADKNKLHPTKEQFKPCNSSENNSKNIENLNSHKPKKNVDSQAREKIEKESLESNCSLKKSQDKIFKKLDKSSVSNNLITTCTLRNSANKNFNSDDASHINSSIISKMNKEKNDKFNTKPSNESNECSKSETDKNERIIKKLDNGQEKHVINSKTRSEKIEKNNKFSKGVKQNTEINTDEQFNKKITKIKDIEIENCVGNVQETLDCSKEVKKNLKTPSLIVRSNTVDTTNASCFQENFSVFEPNLRQLETNFIDKNVEKPGQTLNKLFRKSEKCIQESSLSVKEIMNNLSVESNEVEKVEKLVETNIQSTDENISVIDKSSARCKNKIEPKRSRRLSERRGDALDNSDINDVDNTQNFVKKLIANFDKKFNSSSKFNENSKSSELIKKMRRKSLSDIKDKNTVKDFSLSQTHISKEKDLKTLESQTVVKRGRGRPKKIKDNIEKSEVSVNTDKTDNHNDKIEVVKRPRGRPRKYPKPCENENEIRLDNVNTSIKTSMSNIANYEKFQENTLKGSSFTKDSIEKATIKAKVSLIQNCTGDISDSEIDFNSQSHNKTRTRSSSPQKRSLNSTKKCKDCETSIKIKDKEKLSDKPLETDIGLLNICTEVTTKIIKKSTLDKHKKIIVNSTPRISDQISLDKNCENLTDVSNRSIEKVSTEKSHSDKDSFQCNQKSASGLSDHVSSTISEFTNTDNLKQVDENIQKQLCNTIENNEKISQKEAVNISENDFQMNLNLATEFIESQTNSGNFHENSQMCLDSFISSEVNENLAEVQNISDVIEYLIENNELSSQISAAADEKEPLQNTDLLKNFIGENDIHTSRLFSQEYEKQPVINDRCEKILRNHVAETLKESTECDVTVEKLAKNSTDTSESIKDITSIGKQLTESLDSIKNNSLDYAMQKNGSAKVNNSVYFNKSAVIDDPKIDHNNDKKSLVNDLIDDFQSNNTINPLSEFKNTQINQKNNTNIENLLMENQINENSPDEESYNKARRKTTLMELKKKCQENLGKRLVSNLEKLDKDSNLTVLRQETLPDELMENTPEHEENYPESLCGSIDSEENLSDRLGRLNNPDMPPLSSFDSSDSGFQVTPDEQRPTEKIVLKCSRYTSYLDMSPDFNCKDCDESFVSNRELKKHMKIQHRGNIVIKIKKTDENKHEVEPVHKTKQKQQVENSEDDDENVSSTPASLEDFSSIKPFEDRDDVEIKMKIVKSDGGFRNSHIVKEIKITPKSEGANSTRIPNFSPVTMELISNAPQPVKKRGRPRKYPIFTEAELIAKRLAAEQGFGPPDITKINNISNASSIDTVHSSCGEKLDKPISLSVNYQSNNKKENIQISKNAQLDVSEKFENNKPLSIEKLNQSISNETEDLADTEPLLTDSDLSHTDSDHLFERSSEKSEITQTKNESSKNLQNNETLFENCKKRKRNRTLSQDSIESEISDVISPNKKRKICEDEEEDQSNMRGKYHITKELIVHLTKIDKASEENESNIYDENDFSGIMFDQTKRNYKRMITFNEFECCWTRRTLINPKKLLIFEKNGNKRSFINDVEKCLSSPEKVLLQSHLQEVHKSFFSENHTSVLAIPSSIDENQKAKILMLKNPNDSTNAIVAGSSNSLASTQSSIQPQFCILFIPDGMYNSNSSMSKDVTPTATIVNFQPVPDSEIHTKSMIFTPTTPTKITAPGEQTKPFVCATCTKVLDLIGRLEASLGMTEEDKNAIKCPYCSNNFQSLFYLEYHVMQEHLKCENEKQCKHSGFKSLRIPNLEAASEFEIYITFALKCRSCYDIFNTVADLNDHVMQRHKTLVRLKSSLPSPTKSPPGNPLPGFLAKDGSRSMAFQCPSDCICRIGIRSNTTLTQRQQMIRRCPNAMRYLEKIEPAAYEVYTCILCRTTFLMKNEVVDHLMKMHEVSCKIPCYTCLTSFRTVQMQEKHECIETTLQDLDKMLTIAILPTNVTGKGGQMKYPMREDSATEEYDVTMKSPETHQVSSVNIELKNSCKRKLNGALNRCSNEVKKLKLTNAPGVNSFVRPRKKRNKLCPKCIKRFSYRKSLFDHIIQDHIMNSEVAEEPKKRAIEVLKQWGKEKSNIHVTQEFSELLDAFEVKDKETWQQVLLMNDDDDEKPAVKETECKLPRKKRLTGQCSMCNDIFRLPNNLDKDNNKHCKDDKLICMNCSNDGIKTRRRSIIINGLNANINYNDPHQSTETFDCKKCLKTFRTMIDFKIHKQNEHPTTADNLHICDICKKTFASARMLEKHKKIHRESILDESTSLKTEGTDTNRRNSQEISSECSTKKGNEANDSLNKSDCSRRDSSDSSSASKEPEDIILNCSFCEEVCSSKVSLKNHLKREHNCRASICQFCNSLLIDTSEVRHMLDYHIVPSKSNPRHTASLLANNSVIDNSNEDICPQEDVEELIRTLGKHRLQSLMMYHDFEGKCNNAIMKCPICPELFATRESCRFHYVWIHDDTCLLCDETFRSGSSACQHKIDTHTSTASYLWCIQRLVIAIVNTLSLDPDQPSQVLYQVLAMKLDDEIQLEAEIESMIARTAEKGAAEEVSGANERFLEEVLSEDQLPDSGNMIEVVIGKEDSEDDLLSLLNLSPTYDNRSTNEQHILPSAGVAPPEEEDDDESATVLPATTSVPPSPLINVTSTSVISSVPKATVTTSSPPTENYVTSSVCKYVLGNDEEQLVLVVTDEDLNAFRDDIDSLAERISATCDSLTLDEITEILKAYFVTVNANKSSAGTSTAETNGSGVA